MKDQDTLYLLKDLANKYDLVLLEATDIIDDPLVYFKELNPIFSKLLLEEYLYFYRYGVMVTPDYHLFHQYPEKKLGLIQISPTGLVNEISKRKVVELSELENLSILIVGDNLSIKEDNVKCMSASQILKIN